MAGTYGAPQKKYYDTHKDKIYRRVRKYKLEYNRDYYEKNKDKILKAARDKRALKARQKLIQAVTSVSQCTGKSQ